MKQSGAAFLLAIAAIVATVLLVEGGYALRRGGDIGSSLSYGLYERLVGPPRTETSTGPLIFQKGDFERMIDDLRRDRVAIGNTDFLTLPKEEGSFNYFEGECEFLKPDLNRKMMWIRTTLYEPFDPPLAAWDANRELSAPVADFLATYGLWPITYRTNASGERLTLPSIEQPDKVLVAGDSVANGLGVSDDETLASNLQRRDPSLQYVNIGVASADSRSIICNLERAESRYPGQIRRLVYVFCENDFDKRPKPYSQPEEVIEWLEGFSRRHELRGVTIVFAPYIYNVFPDLTRIKGTRGWGHKTFVEQKERLRKATRAAGFEWVDVMALAQERMKERRSVMAGLALFADHAHWSPEGNVVVAEQVLAR